MPYDRHPISDTITSECKTHDIKGWGGVVVWLGLGVGVGLGAIICLLKRSELSVANYQISIAEFSATNKSHQIPGVI